MTTTTLPLFWHLSSSSRKDRIDASVKLIGALERFQSQFTPTDVSPSRQQAASDNSEDEEGNAAQSTRKGDGLDALNSQDVAYSLRRLIRGLASPRESSRLGFAVALTEVRMQTPSIAHVLLKDSIGSFSRG